MTTVQRATSPVRMLDAHERFSFRAESPNRAAHIPSPRTTLLIEADDTPFAGSWPKTDTARSSQIYGDADTDQPSPPTVRRSVNDKEFRLSSYGSGHHELPPSPPSSRSSLRRETPELEHPSDSESEHQVDITEAGPSSPSRRPESFHEQTESVVEDPLSNDTAEEKEYDFGEPSDLRTARSKRERSPRLSIQVPNDPTQHYSGSELATSKSQRSPITLQEPYIPHSSYYVGPPGLDSAFGTRPTGQIGVHYPREIVRIERDYSTGELPQFHPTYPLELEGRITPTQFQETINDINEILISAYDTRASCMENTLAVLTVYLSTLFRETHYDKEMRRLASLVDERNTTMYHPQGLHILWPRKSAFMFLEIEYY